MKKQKIDVDRICIDGGTQVREQLNQGTVDDYARTLEAGEKLPLPIIYEDSDGVLWLADGFHRLAAHKQAGRDQIEAEVRSGSKSDAQWFATTANSKHGLPLNRDDKRRAIEAVLRHPNGQSLSNVQIAKHVGASDKTVASVREQLESTSEIPKLDQRSGADGKVRKVKPKRKFNSKSANFKEEVHQDKTGDPDIDGFELVEDGFIHQSDVSVQEILANLPELSPDVILQGIGGNQDRFIEIHPCPERKGYYYLLVYYLPDADGKAWVEYDKRPGRYTREILATSLKEVHQVKPNTWRAIPATGVVPWPVLSHDKQTS